MSTNESETDVKKRVEIAKLMVEFLEFINAPEQFYIARDLQLYYPLEELKIAGVDMTDPKVVESAIKMFDEAINEFNELYNS